MPVKSYLVVPQKGKKEQLQNKIKFYSSCEVTRAENKDVLVVVTQTANEEEDKKLYNELNNLEELQLITLVSAFTD